MVLMPSDNSQEVREEEEEDDDDDDDDDDEEAEEAQIDMSHHISEHSDISARHSVLEQDKLEQDTKSHCSQEVELVGHWNSAVLLALGVEEPSCEYNAFLDHKAPPDRSSSGEHVAATEYNHIGLGVVDMHKADDTDADKVADLLEAVALESALESFHWEAVDLVLVHSPAI